MKKNIICIDLMETLIARNDELFASYLSGVLGLNDAQNGELKSKIRQRYIEYSFGNFHADSEYVENLITPFATGEITQNLIDEISGHLLDNYWAIDGSKQFLSELKALGYTLYAASNFVASWAEELLKRFGMMDYFDGVFISSDIRYRKPAREFFDYITEKINRSASEIYFVGNSYVNDYLGSQKVGMTSILLKKNNVTGRGVTYTEIVNQLKHNK